MGVSVGSGSGRIDLRTGQEIMRKGREGGPEKEELGQGESSPGIVVTDTTVDSSQNGDGPRIAAFIWGGKVAPTATLPYGRWKGAA